MKVDWIGNGTFLDSVTYIAIVVRGVDTFTLRAEDDGSYYCNETGGMFTKEEVYDRIICHAIKNACCFKCRGCELIIYYHRECDECA